MTLTRLLKGDLSSLSLKLSLKVISGSLVSSLLKNLRSALNEILSFLQAKTCDLTNDLDDLDLVRANLGQLNIELGLLFCRCSTCCRASYYDACCCRYAKLFLTSLYQLIELKN